MTTPHKSLLHPDRCSQSHCSVTASNGGCSSASGLMSLQAGDHLMPTLTADSRLFRLKSLLLYKAPVWTAQSTQPPTVLPLLWPCDWCEPLPSNGCVCKPFPSNSCLSGLLVHLSGIMSQYSQVKSKSKANPCIHQSQARTLFWPKTKAYE
jgi:hypothetical protein